MNYISTKQASRRLMGDCIHKTLKAMGFEISMEERGREKFELVYFLRLESHPRLQMYCYSALTEYSAEQVGSPEMDL